MPLRQISLVPKMHTRRNQHPLEHQPNRVSDEGNAERCAIARLTVRLVDMEDGGGPSPTGIETMKRRVKCHPTSIFEV